MSSSRSAGARIGVVGGTFDPIHIAHLIAGSEALHRFALDRVLFVPAGQPWQKSSYSEPEDRYMMTALAVEDHPAFTVSRMELDRRGPTITADTMTALRDFYGRDSSLFFISGADAVANLGTWEKLDILRDTTEIIAVNRPGFDIGRLNAASDWPRIHTLSMPAIEISASEIRRRVRDGAPIDFLVARRTAEYIRTHGLYLGDAGAEVAS
ncbi:MAG: nicotinate-nucleotide adenylyltransferase [Actinomycetota bacterium]|nr:nicotinate-nucleotide adenylyltransferase [Actinomycetota bacterium]